MNGLMFLQEDRQIKLVTPGECQVMTKTDWSHAAINEGITTDQQQPPPVGRARKGALPEPQRKQSLASERLWTRTEVLSGWHLSATPKTQECILAPPETGDLTSSQWLPRTCVF